MATYAECLAALPSFRNDLLRSRELDPGAGIATPAAFSPRGAFAAFATPLTNVHATGVGVRSRGKQYDLSEYVIKVYVFDKVEEDTPEIPRVYEAAQQIPVDVEYLPVQVVRASKKEGRQERQPGAKKKLARARKETRAEAQAAKAVAAAPPIASLVAPQVLPPQRDRLRPIVGGVSISPLNANFVGTLGCFLLRRNVDTEEVFVLSNNHVLANVDLLPLGTQIVQPGPEVPPL